MWPGTEKTSELLAEAQQGDDTAVNQLFDRHRAAVQRMIALRLDHKIRRRVAVSDVVQDVMIEANRRLADYLANPQMPFHLWLRHIARDRIIDAHRRHRASKRNVDREQPMVGHLGADRSTMDLIAQLRDDQLTPAAAAAQHEMAECVEAAISRLAEQDAEIIFVRHYEQLTNQEAAQALGLTEPAVGMRYLRAVRRLREMLEMAPDDQSNESAE